MYKPAFLFAGRLTAAVALLMTLAITAQADNTYRAEIVVLERLADPLLAENMTNKQPERTVGEKRLWVVDPAGNAMSDIRTTQNLTLNTAAARLENSGKYRVLMKTGWIQRFPPNYSGDPMQISVGDLLEGAGHRAVEGTIEINRRRYLLVNVELNHWRESSGTTTTNTMTDPEEGAATEASETQTTGVGTSPASVAAMGSSQGKELVTWIRETRRMRSKEIHFLDSPTIGVLVYFRPLD